MSEQSVGDVGRRRLFRYGAVAAVAVVSAGLGAAGSAALLGPGEGAVSAGRAEPPVRTPDEALARLRAGNERWVAGTARHPNQSLARRRAVAGKQQPYAVVMGCIDSRVAPELVFDAGIGDLFVLRTAAHTLDDLIEGSDEYGPAENGTPVLLVLGHQRCGAVTAAVETLLDGLPNYQRLFTLRIGQNIREMFEADMAVEAEAVDRLRRGIEVMRAKGDTTSARLFEDILADEEGHLDYLETQLSLLDQLGEALYLAQLVDQPAH